MSIIGGDAFTCFSRLGEPPLAERIHGNDVVVRTSKYTVSKAPFGKGLGGGDANLKFQKWRRRRGWLFKLGKDAVKVTVS